MRTIVICGRKGHGKDTVAGRLVRKYNFTQIAFADPIKRIAHEILDIDADSLWGPSPLRERRLSDVLHDTRKTKVNEAYWLRCAERMDAYTPMVNDLFVDLNGARHCVDPIPSLGFFLQRFAAKRDHELTVRHILQHLGTEWGRSLWADVWCVDALRTMSHLRSGGAYDAVQGRREQTRRSGTPRLSDFVVSDCRYPDNEVKLLTGKGTHGKLWWVDAERRIPTVFHAGQTEHSSEPTMKDIKKAGHKPRVIDNNGTRKDLFHTMDRALRHILHA